jgi:hypothetical protein
VLEGHEDRRVGRRAPGINPPAEVLFRRRSARPLCAAENTNAIVGAYERGTLAWPSGVARGRRGGLLLSGKCGRAATSARVARLRLKRSRRTMSASRLEQASGRRGPAVAARRMQARRARAVDAPPHGRAPAPALAPRRSYHAIGAAQLRTRRAWASRFEPSAENRQGILG